ncbi:uncharacterized protein LOC143905165 [Temnothorax americanus]|uniref:uncharacterized protein LOC143905165 n=1 Tax=Temnothorax americanus TaxID=1964332 RepID=UPI004067B841
MICEQLFQTLVEIGSVPHLVIDALQHKTDIMANTRELWYYFDHISYGFVKCRLCKEPTTGDNFSMINKMQSHIQWKCPYHLHPNFILNTALPYKFRNDYTSLNGIATCIRCGFKTKCGQTYKLTRHLDNEHPDLRKESQRDPSIPSSEPRPSTSREYGIDPSAGHQYQEQSVLREQVFEQHLKTIKETVKRTVKSVVETIISNSPPGPSPEQTTKNPGPVDKPNPTTSTRYGMDSSTNLPVSPILPANWLADVLKNIQEINKSVIEAVTEAVVEVMESANSPSVPSPQPGPSTSREYDREYDNSSKRRSRGQPDSQVLSSEQTTRNSGAVDTPGTSALPVSNMGPSVSEQIEELSISSGQGLIDKDDTGPVDIEELAKLVKDIRASKIHSPSVPSSKPGPSTAERYDINPSERENDDRTRSGEQPDSQVLSSEQTRKRKGAVDDNVANADTNDIRKRQKSAETDTDDDE